MFYVFCTLLNVLTSFAIILMGKRELVALLSLSSWRLLIVVWFFLAVPWVCLQFVIVVFPDHTQLLFLQALDLKSTNLPLIHCGPHLLLFDLMLYVQSTICQLNRDGSSWVEPVLRINVSYSRTTAGFVKIVVTTGVLYL